MSEEFFSEEMKNLLHIIEKSKLGLTTTIQKKKKIKTLKIVL